MKGQCLNGGLSQSLVPACVFGLQLCFHKPTKHCHCYEGNAHLKGTSGSIMSTEERFILCVCQGCP
jgi:hypothetical protein